MRFSKVSAYVEEITQTAFPPLTARLLGSSIKVRAKSLHIVGKLPLTVPAR
jgi:hypothetical protein